MTNKFAGKLSLNEKALFALAGSVVIAGSICIQLMVPAHVNAQSSPAETAARKSGESGLRFEVASVKRSDPSRSGPGRRLTLSEGRYGGEKVSFLGMAWDAYGIKEDYQIEAPFPWMRTERYDLAAKVPEGATIGQVRIMLQHLLAERFGLVVRLESRLVPGYRLVVAKGGAKLKKSVAAPTIDVSGPSIVTKNGTTQFADNAKSGLRLTIEEEQLHGRQETMGGLAHYLVQALHTPVIDTTGIQGEYDYDLSFAPPEHGPLPKGDVIVLPSGADVPVAQTSLDPLGKHPTLFSVITKELGLQLESAKISIDVLVLDKANPNPTEN